MLLYAVAVPGGNSVGLGRTKARISAIALALDDIAVLNATVRVRTAFRDCHPFDDAGQPSRLAIVQGGSCETIGLVGEPDLFGLGVLDDPYEAYAVLRRETPVWRVPGTRTWLITSWDLVSEATSRVNDFSSNLTALLISGPNGQPVEFDMTSLGTAIDVLATADDPGHGTHRRLVFPHLVPARLQAMQDELELLADQLWRDGASGDGIEWMSAVADRMPLTVIARVLGFPNDDVPQLLRWAYEGTELLSGVATSDRMAYLGQSAAAIHTDTSPEGKVAFS